MGVAAQQWELQAGWLSGNFVPKSCAEGALKACQLQPGSAVRTLPKHHRPVSRMSGTFQCDK